MCGNAKTVALLLACTFARVVGTSRDTWAPDGSFVKQHVLFRVGVFNRGWRASQPCGACARGVRVCGGATLASLCLSIAKLSSVACVATGGCVSPLDEPHDASCVLACTCGLSVRDMLVLAGCAWPDTCGCARAGYASHALSKPRERPDVLTIYSNLTSHGKLRNSLMLPGSATVVSVCRGM